jgi:hypothetical protein
MVIPMHALSYTCLSQINEEEETERERGREGVWGYGRRAGSTSEWLSVIVHGAWTQRACAGGVCEG